MSEQVTDRSTVDALRADFQVRLAAAVTDAAVKALADEFLGRKSGSVTGLMKTLGSLAPDARREFGALVNAPAAEARITKVLITATESPTFGGYTWPGVGQ